ncbi:hypothetical protein Ndes2526B_g05318 [Nannochloris sp. 'desiccata']|nr:hypothetical protein KSW81_006325 [Chlorella desiccata (nom. nud.)]KAG7674580.1 hypothetical protein KSW81_000229 [Chlorella desiccata (nom. nud.)]KAH7620068.1 putative Cyclin-dependent kinases regulatory subunit 1 [Chlorella desiccata (nom. nud.)]
MADAQPRPPAQAPKGCDTPGLLYSERYYDEVYEYRHVIYPKEMACRIPRDRLMTENEWRALGIQQSRGWNHYATHKPERHILLFKRKKGFAPPPKKPLSPPRKPAQRGLAGSNAQQLTV